MINRIRRYLKSERGLDTGSCRTSMLLRRLERRFKVTGSLDPGRYLAYLKAHPEEADILINSLNIHVSWFFRDPLVFETLAKKILPALIDQKSVSGDAAPLRIWSAGCSFGEEPYTLSILIHEIRRKNQPVAAESAPGQIFATDIDTSALNKARDAVYSCDSVREVKFGLLQRYFHPVSKTSGRCMPDEQERYQLDPTVKELVCFSCYDMLDSNTHAPPESVFGEFDMILCRNLLIYFSREARERIMYKLCRSLSPGGYLILGEQERPPSRFREGFSRVDRCCRIYRKKESCIC